MISNLAGLEKGKKKKNSREDDLLNNSLQKLFLQKAYYRWGTKDWLLFSAIVYPIMTNAFPSWLCLSKHC